MRDVYFSKLTEVSPNVLKLFKQRNTYYFCSNHGEPGTEVAQHSSTFPQEYLRYLGNFRVSFCGLPAYKVG